MSMLEGRLHFGPVAGQKRAGGLFAKGTNSRPLEIKNTGFLLSDLESFWGFTPSKANAAVAQLERDGHVELSVTVDEQAVNKLFL